MSLVDVFPTVLALAGFDSKVKVHGRSLLPLMYQSAAGPTYAYAESMSPGLQYGWSELHALRSPRYKFIQAPRAELYDLTTDPGEATNVLAQHPDIARDMSRELARLMAGTSENAPAPEEANLDKETMERLASLGYMGGSQRRATSADAPLADPKDKLDSVRRGAARWRADGQRRLRAGSAGARRRLARRSGHAAGAADVGNVLSGARAREGCRNPIRPRYSKTIRRACRG